MCLAPLPDSHTPARLLAHQYSYICSPSVMFALAKKTVIRSTSASAKHDVKSTNYAPSTSALKPQKPSANSGQGLNATASSFVSMSSVCTKFKPSSFGHSGQLFPPMATRECHCTTSDNLASDTPLWHSCPTTL